jgi:hypothetical protein
MEKCPETCGACQCTSSFFQSESLKQHVGGSCRPDHPVLVEVPDENRSASASSSLGVANCTGGNTWIDTSGNTCDDYQLNAEAMYNTYDCAFSGETIRQDVGALTDGVGEYGRYARCRWIIVSKSASSLTLSITELDVKVLDKLRVYKCLFNSSCVPGLLEELGQSPFSSTANDNLYSLPVTPGLFCAICLELTSGCDRPLVQLVRLVLERGLLGRSAGVRCML